MRWLGFDWGEHLYHASDYFEQLYDWAEQLIKDGKAYVDDQSRRRCARNRGTLDRARHATARSATARVEENLDLFRRMRAGEFPDGARVLRAKIDMASGNINLRDPVLYRILHAAHHRTGDDVVHLPELRLRARPVGRASRASRTPSARWSSRTTGRSTTGSSRTCRSRRARASTSSRASTSPTPCCRSAS